MDDQAVLEIAGARLAFTTDSFVVTPIFFPGGDIGSLAVNGTVNDLAMSGAKPLYLSAAFILEEGLPVDELARVVDSMARAAQNAGVQLVTGDTKVVNRGKGDKIFITTTGIGLVDRATQLSADRARPGDKILLSGYIGDHGITILSQRERPRVRRRDRRATAPRSTAWSPPCSTPPNPPATSMASACMRDPTRGGVATDAQRNRQALPRRHVAARTGNSRPRSPSAAPAKCSASIRSTSPTRASWSPSSPRRSPTRSSPPCNAHPLGADSRIIGEVVEPHPGMVLMKTAIGGTRVVDVLFGEQLPRIC